MTAHGLSMSNSLILQLSKDEMRSRVLRSGCDLLVHQLETVVVFLPNCSASHLLVLFFSTNTILSLFKSFIS